jgi:hypothetical protein
VNPPNAPGDEDDAVIVDDSNSVMSHNAPPTESLRKHMKEWLEKQRRLLELKEEMKKQQEKKRTHSGRGSGLIS